jgi:hypothetical protein
MGVGPKIADLVQVHGRGLVQVIVSSHSPLVWYVFLNGKCLTPVELEDLMVELDGPAGVFRAALTYKGTNLEGKPGKQFVELFPCTLMLTNGHTRFSITCQDPTNPDLIWIRAGLREDGAEYELSGVQKLKFLITEGIMEGVLTWSDNREEKLFVSPGTVN